jgi:ParB-like chromosome segregation protein Spo0J
MPTARFEQVSLAKLRENPRNAHTHPKRQIRQIADSIHRFGFTSPIITDDKYVILAGHGRWHAAKLLGLRIVPVIALHGLGEAERRAYLLADNKLAEMAGWDRSALALELSELAPLLAEAGLDVEITGFNPAEIDLLLGDIVDNEGDPADTPPPSAHEAVSQRGDLWRLGRHRLLCGDAREAADLERLMRRERAAVVITDPPFNVRVRSVQGRGKRRHREFIAASGEMSRQQFTCFLRETLSLAGSHSADGSLHYVFMDWCHLREMLDAGEEVYSELKNVVVWNKTNAGQGSFYRSQHELIFVWKNGDGPHLNNVELGQHGRNRSNVWTYAGVNTFRSGRLEDLSIHPTVKPVALIADAMRDCSRRGDIVLDPFMGSGTMIMAAERVARSGYGLELDPNDLMEGSREDAEIWYVMLLPLHGLASSLRGYQNASPSQVIRLRVASGVPDCPADSAIIRNEQDTVAAPSSGFARGIVIGDEAGVVGPNVMPHLMTVPSRFGYLGVATSSVYSPGIVDSGRFIGAHLSTTLSW